MPQIPRIYDESWESLLGIMPIERNSDNEVTKVVCRFCVAFGRESKSEEEDGDDGDSVDQGKKRKRGPRTTTKHWKAPWRRDHITTHMKECHKSKFDEYSALSRDGQKNFFNVSEQEIMDECESQEQDQDQIKARVSSISDQQQSTTNRREVVEYLTKRFPLHLAEEWDNVGLLVETRVNDQENDEAKVFLTNDLTEAVANEAISLGCNFIMTYHPTPFRGLKRVTMSDVTQRIVAKCIQNDVWVFSPHTACDNALSGVNDWLIMYENPKVIQITDTALKCGRGRIVKLPEPLPMIDVVNAYKKHLGVSSIQFAASKKLVDDSKRTSSICKDAMKNAMVSTIAVQAGAGASVLNGVDADLFVSGEMSHHDCLAAVANGTSVVLVGHSNSERGYLVSLCQEMTNVLQLHDIRVSKIDSDPLVTL